MQTCYILLKFALLSASCLNSAGHHWPALLAEMPNWKDYYQLFTDSMVRMPRRWCDGVSIIYITLVALTSYSSILNTIICGPNTHTGHSVSDQPMVCESPLRFRWNLAHLQIMPKKNSVKIFRDVGRAVSEIWPSKKWKNGRFLRRDPSIKCK